MRLLLFLFYYAIALTLGFLLRGRFDAWIYRQPHMQRALVRYASEVVYLVENGADSVDSPPLTVDAPAVSPVLVNGPLGRFVRSEAVEQYAEPGSGHRRSASGRRRRPRCAARGAGRCRARARRAVASPAAQCGRSRPNPRAAAAGARGAPVVRTGARRCSTGRRVRRCSTATDGCFRRAPLGACSARWCCWCCSSAFGCGGDIRPAGCGSAGAACASGVRRSRRGSGTRWSGPRHAAVRARPRSIGPGRAAARPGGPAGDCASGRVCAARASCSLRGSAATAPPFGGGGRLVRRFVGDCGLAHAL